MLKTCELALAPSKPGGDAVPQVFVFYSHHRPHLAHRDMQFFEKAEQRGWVCEEIYTKTFPVRVSLQFQLAFALTIQLV